jgi:excinuclease ABC subunit C
VIALATDGVYSGASVLQIRAGRLQGQEHFTLEGAHPDEMGEAIGQFVQQYYQRSPQLPRQVLLSHEPADADMLQAWLRSQPLREGRRGSVHLLIPQRGEKRRLVELALENAKQYLQDRKNRLASDQGRAEEAMLDLQEGLDLPRLPYRIECYDISNTQGTESVGAMVVFAGGQPQKDAYRKFKIRGVSGPNDYASLQEVLRRRLERGIEGDAKFSDMPDLIVIDGGKGQLSAACEVTAELGVEIPTISLAKRFEEVFLPGRSDPEILPRNSQALFLLQRLRDEAHRFGLTYHRKLRGKKQTRSALDDVRGIGARRRQALLKHFGSVDKMKQASVQELAMAPGMTRPVAEELYRNLHA